MKIKKLLVTVGLLGIIILTFINYFDSQIGYLLVTCFMALTTSFLFIKELKVLGNYFIAYMFNLKTDFFNKKIEKPRLFTYLIFGFLSVIYTIQYHQLNKDLFLNRYYISTLFFLIFLGCNLVLFFTWHENFEKNFVTIIQKKILSKRDKKYELKWDKENLKSIYINLEERDFIELLDANSKTLDYLLFSKLFTSGKTPELPVFILNMDNIQTKYFYDLLSKDSQGFTLDDFLKIFQNKNGTPNPGSLSASYSTAIRKRSGPKQKKDIESVFKRLR